MEYGGCSRFWYGGCQGNDNSFDTDDRCKATCVQPEGRDVCELPLVRGPCEGDYPAWYYQPSAGRCVRFSYGGCLGNANRFDGEQECRDRCVVSDILDPCRQEVKPGPCGGSIRRWYFDGTSSLCTAFSYGGCKANLNNFLTEGECRHRCSRPGTQAVCSLPRAEGDCDTSLPRWYFDYSQSRCTPFYYSGCGANLNHFTSEADCHTACPERLYAAEACADRLEPGPCSNFSTRYWYSLQTGRCRPFQYGGCDGNRNRFASQAACQLRCEANKAQVDAVGFRSEWCQLPADPGSCAGREVRWHYDSRDGLCSELLYSGCGGNQNRFASEHQCQQRCSSSQDVCSLPRLVGPCSGSLRQFYFDTRLARCLEFDFSGCQGNGNRFNSLAECEARCRSEEQPTATERVELERTSERPDPGPDDVCQLGHDPGPCRVPTRAWFFRASEGACRQFTYGGCAGNDNKFVSEEQCQRLCGPFKGHDACNTPPSAGDCGGHVVRWYFDGREGTCTAFAYTGCGGNVNRFATEEECRVICVSGRELQVPDSRAPQRPAEPEETVTSPSPVPVPVPVPAGRPADCAEAMEHCRRIVCPMGVERTVDARLCERCSCYQPCSRVVCGPRERCIITQRRDEDDGLVITAACRRSSKPGFCVLPDEGVQCSGDSKAGCRDDADCRNNLKCCSEGCQLRCLPPEGEREVSVQGIWPTSSPDVRATPFEAGTKWPEVTIATTRPDYPATTATTPVSTTPDGRARIVEASSAVEVPEGSLAVLRCVADGNPQPIVTWLRGAEQVDTERGRYQLDGDGSLQIVGVRSDDAGEYTCSADNYRAQPDRRSMTLAVLEPTPSPARVLPTPLEQQPVANLGGPAVIRCHAYGWPRPSVTWWRDRSMLPLSSAQYRQDTSHALQLSVVRLPDLGVYTCQAYNGQGQAVAWSAQLRAHGPVDAAPPHLWPFLRFVVTQPAAAGVAEVPVARAPPRELDGSRREAAFPARRPADRVYQPEYVRPAAPAGAVPVAVSINLTESTFAVGAEVRIPCRVSGRPPPVVTWHKDGNVVREHGRTRLTGTDLLVGYAQPSDSGQYRCRAVNRYSRAESSVTIRVQGIYIDPSCTDNPFFANCRLIVAARYCSNNYYSRFCCRSCTLDGQLPPRGPHLDTSRGYFQARQTTRVLSPGPEVVGGRRRLPRRRRLHRLKVRFGSRRRRPSAALVTAAPAGAPTAAPAEAADPAT